MSKIGRPNLIGWQKSEDERILASKEHYERYLEVVKERKEKGWDE